MSAKYDSKRTKTDVLIEEGTFNPTPEKVRDPKFRGSEFFRSARRRAGQIRDAASRLHRQGFGDGGLRRVRCFQANLLPGQGELRHGRDCGIGADKAGPRRPHKIDDKVLAFLQAQLGPGEPVRARELAKLLRQDLDIELHPRSIERVLKKSSR